jgi:hypothetical protein
MASRPVLLVALLTTLSIGCSQTTRQMSAAPARPPDPERWARAACLRGEYPSELDGRAYAWARQRDLTAERQGLADASATARLIDARMAFGERCTTWREHASVITVVSTGRSGQ